MPDDDIERRLRKLSVEHAETRWLALRVDDDLKEVREDLRAVRSTQGEHSAVLAGHSAVLAEHTAALAGHSAVLAEHTAVLTEHTARFDSVDSQLRSLTQLVGQVLERLPDSDEER